MSGICIRRKTKERLRRITGRTFRVHSSQSREMEVRRKQMDSVRQRLSTYCVAWMTTSILLRILHASTSVR
ncbi:hypothetical protein BD311DRAFT_772008 [Dichomitus squalens]|uniref:Uncharacterized protein n=1 Tax=Dichomitus squalens TaxID=114155 RepID=A0A4Q9M6R4_9APHY|nr:hypothetical protein BD311DRAFT_772008 [Dichomitus squalens]